MTRTLAFVATTGLIGAAAFLTIGIALAGPSWTDAAGLWGIGKSTCGPATSARRQVTLPFATSDSLAIHMPASVHYQPGDRAEAVISGDPALLDNVRFEAGVLGLDCDPGWFASRLEVELSGPSISIWELRGSGDLTLSQINQPKLQVTIEGSGDVTATGTADAVDLRISGSGEAQFGDLTAKSVKVDIRGSGDARLTAQVDADVSISGSGDIELFGRPTMRRSEIRGSGSIQQMP
ncbi:head GIN domain-containing protein [Neorhizobium tomejilense]|uniref:head GIN domain-containing protein n=1 Tax=Neorhizobium tomejilense TaxID=2093828 RepID=UPI003ECD7AFC